MNSAFVRGPVLALVDSAVSLVVAAVASALPLLPLLPHPLIKTAATARQAATTAKDPLPFMQSPLFPMTYAGESSQKRSRYSISYELHGRQMSPQARWECRRALQVKKRLAISS